MRYRILGPLEVWADGGRTSLGAGRQQALLALLLLRRNELLTMDRIVDALWGERAPQTAAKVVQGYVSQLRRALGDGVLLTRPPGYELRVADGELDADVFDELVARSLREPAAEAARTLRGALALWRGEPLPEVAYESFAQAEIARLEELRLVALEGRVDADLALGRAPQLVPELEALVREHPLRERARGQLMLALYRAGRQSDALDTYVDYRRRLVDELGLEPGAELQQLQRQILATDSALGSVRRMPLAVAARRAPLLLIGGVLIVAAAVAAALLLTRTSSAVAVRSNDVVAIDPQTGHFVGAASVGETPSHVVVGHGAVWVVNADDRTISKIDPHTLDVRTVSPGETLTDIAVGGGAVWAARGPSPIVTRLDPGALTVEQEVRLPVQAISPGGFVASDARSVWVSGGGPRGFDAWRIDPRTNHVVRKVALLSGGGWDALGFGSLWIRGDTDLLRLNERTGALQSTVDLPSNAYVFEDTGGIAVSERSVWVTSAASQAVWEIDPGTNAPASSVAVGGVPSGIAIGAGSVWVTNRTDGAVLRIDPVNHRVERVIRIGHSPNGIAFGYGRVWVSVD